MELRFFALLIFLPVVVLAQSPKVPSRLDFADMKLRITEDARREIQQDVDRLRRSPTYFNNQAEKARSYFPIIERVFREEKLPLDFKYLVLQESGLIPDAVSSSNAVGFWQFKDFTAMEVGLRVDRHIDERMNIEASSRGAARYLKKNNNTFFDNWLMSLQAYQMGAGAAIKVGADKHRGVKSMVINKKTYWYVKKYLAHKIAYEGDVEGKAQIKLIEHRSGGNETLAEIADLYRVEADEVEEYNKWLRKGRIPKDKAYTVIIPSENASLVSLTSVTEEPQSVSINAAETNVVAGIDYRFQDADAFPKIDNESEAREGHVVNINGLPGIVAGQKGKIPELAEKGGIELSQFLKINDLSINDQLVAGQVYYLKPKRSKGRTHYHIAQPGETLWAISQKYGVKLKKLRTKNRMSVDEKVKPGRVIWLRYIRPARVPVEYRETEQQPQPQMIVKEPTDPSDTELVSATEETGDTPKEVVGEPKRPMTFLEKLDSLERLESTVGTGSGSETTVQLPVTSNGQNATSELQAINTSGTDSSGTQSETVAVQSPDSILRTHVVKAGETYYAVSKKYGVTVREVLWWNDLDINDKLSIGQELRVYESSPQQASPPASSHEVQTGAFTIYTVSEGDTLYSIARSHQVSVKEIMEWNNKEEMGIKLGEKIKIKKAGNN